MAMETDVVLDFPNRSSGLQPQLVTSKAITTANPISLRARRTGVCFMALLFPARGSLICEGLDPATLETRLNVASRGFGAVMGYFSIIGYLVSRSLKIGWFNLDTLVNHVLNKSLDL